MPSTRNLQPGNVTPSLTPFTPIDRSNGLLSTGLSLLESRFRADAASAGSTVDLEAEQRVGEQTLEELRIGYQSLRETAAAEARNKAQEITDNEGWIPDSHFVADSTNLGVTQKRVARAEEQLGASRSTRARLALMKARIEHLERYPGDVQALNKAGLDVSSMIEDSIAEAQAAEEERAAANKQVANSLRTRIPSLFEANMSDEETIKKYRSSVFYQLDKEKVEVADRLAVMKNQQELDERSFAQLGGDITPEERDLLEVEGPAAIRHMMVAALQEVDALPFESDAAKINALRAAAAGAMDRIRTRVLPPNAVIGGRAEIYLQSAEDVLNTFVAKYDQETAANVYGNAADIEKARAAPAEVAASVAAAEASSEYYKWAKSVGINPRMVDTLSAFYRNLTPIQLARLKQGSNIEDVVKVIATELHNNIFGASRGGDVGGGSGLNIVRTPSQPTRTPADADKVAVVQTRTANAAYAQWDTLTPNEKGAVATRALSSLASGETWVVTKDGVPELRGATGLVGEPMKVMADKRFVDLAKTEEFSQEFTPDDQAKMFAYVSAVGKYASRTLPNVELKVDLDAEGLPYVSNLDEIAAGPQEKMGRGRASQTNPKHDAQVVRALFDQIRTATKAFAHTFGKDSSPGVYKQYGEQVISLLTQSAESEPTP